jgi:predicted MFS family arabinose efflux permease
MIGAMNTDTSTPRITGGRLALIVASRFVLNAIFRVAYPLVPFIERDFGVDVKAATWIVTIQVALGPFSLLGGWLGERLGYRQTMLIGLAWSLLGVLGIAFAPSLPLLITAYGACGLGIALFQPAQQAYVSVLTPYHERGRTIGLVELSWALAGMVAVPPLLWLIGVQGSLTAAFVVLGACLAVAMLLVLAVLPPEPRTQRATTTAASWGLLADPSVRGLVLFLFLALAGNEMFYVVQAPWANARFPAAVDLGVASFVFGVGELLGAFGSTIFTDRLGKRRAAALGFVGAALVFVVLPLMALTWPLYLAGYFVFAVVIEFAIVAALTFASTVSVIGRATVMALATAAINLGRAVASQIGAASLGLVGFAGNALIGAALILVAVMIALRFVRENERELLHEPAA